MIYMQDEQINKTFNAIRSLPPQVSYESIHALVLGQPPAIYLHPNHIWFNLKNIIIMTTSVSIISALLLFNYSSDVKTLQPVKEQKKEIAKQEIVLPQEKPVQQVVTKEAVPAAPKKEKKKVMSAPVVAAIQPVIAVAPRTDEAPKIIGESPVADTGLEDLSALPLINSCSPHPPFPCNCACNDGNNVTCTFKEKLLDDEIISDSDKFSFKLDSKSFTVNGKEQPENIFKKYSRVYKELTGKKLNEGSSMTVTVEKGNCSINININD